ncbi:MAG: zinc ribbon domain-containing protein [Dehalococcoidales bacterium]|nr:zinc ribbon domain-containing protein [Dehalococcoidales bacterium]
MMIKEPLQIIKAKQKAHPHITPDRKTMFCPECGESLHDIQIINEYVCSGCRFVVGESDKFCWHCGEELKGLSEVHYWCNNNELDHEAFKNLADALKLKGVKS